jgi:hypothetical protein
MLTVTAFLVRLEFDFRALALDCKAKQALCRFAVVIFLLLSPTFAMEIEICLSLDLEFLFAFLS